MSAPAAGGCNRTVSETASGKVVFFPPQDHDRQPRRCRSKSQLSRGDGPQKLWTGCQVCHSTTRRKITNKLRLTFTCTLSLELLIRLMCVSLDFGRNWEHLEGTQADTGKNMQIAPESNPQPSCDSAISCVTASIRCCTSSCAVNQ